MKEKMRTIIKTPTPLHFEWNSFYWYKKGLYDVREWNSRKPFIACPLAKRLMINGSFSRMGSEGKPHGQDHA